MRLFPTLKGYKLEYLPKDIFSGIIISAVSIPIAMGYAQIAGLPAVYGLYGSVLPILFFALFSTSRQFVFGVDATPAAIVGGAIAAHGFSSESEQAMLYIPMVALFAGLWLILFFFLRADKIVDFISTPVMGGFISGIAVTIILMQVPKLMGSPAGRGEILELAKHIWNSLPYINWLSLAMARCNRASGRRAAVRSARSGWRGAEAAMPPRDPAGSCPFPARAPCGTARRTEGRSGARS